MTGLFMAVTALRRVFLAGLKKKTESKKLRGKPRRRNNGKAAAMVFAPGWLRCLARAPERARRFRRGRLWRVLSASCSKKLSQTYAGRRNKKTYRSGWRRGSLAGRRIRAAQKPAAPERGGFQQFPAETVKNRRTKEKRSKKEEPQPISWHGHPL